MMPLPLHQLKISIQPFYGHYLKAISLSKPYHDLVHFKTLQKRNNEMLHDQKYDARRQLKFLSIH